MKGPDLANSLVGVLTRFRKNKVALVADVKAMFHQIKVDLRNQNAPRFLWWTKGDLYKESKVHKMIVHPFGATSSPSCANFCLKQTAREFGHLYPSMISGPCFIISTLTIAWFQFQQLRKRSRCNKNSQNFWPDAFFT